MGMVRKILFSLFFIVVMIAGIESLDDNPPPTTGGQYFQHSHSTDDNRAEPEPESDPVFVTKAYGGNGGASDVASFENDEDISEQTYAYFSSHTYMLSKMAPDSMTDDDLVFLLEQGYRRGAETDSAFYGDDRKAVLDPGSITVLGFGLIALFALVRLRFRR